jgi:hypothetical protein
MVQADFLSCVRAIYNNIFTLAVTQFELCSDIWKCIETDATLTFIDNSTKAGVRERRSGTYSSTHAHACLLFEFLFSSPSSSITIISEQGCSKFR